MTDQQYPYRKGISLSKEHKRKISEEHKGQIVWNKDRFSISNREKLFKFYWDDLLSCAEIAEIYNVKYCTVKRAMNRLNVPKRTSAEKVKLAANGGRTLLNGYWYEDKEYEHRKVYESFYNCKLKRSNFIHHKDFEQKNNHPLNLQKVTGFEHRKIHKETPRLPLYEIYLRMAELIALRSTCIRAKTGAVIASHDLTKIYSVGYNGNIKGGVNSCNGIEGGCNCIHAEENALLKVTAEDKNKVLFCNFSPCRNCAKKIIQSGFSDIFYREEYRDTISLKLLHFNNIRTCQYTLWKEY